MRFKKTAIGITIISSAVLILTFSWKNDFSIVQFLRTQYPSVYPIIRYIVWELDEEISNVGNFVNAPLMELKLSKADLAHFDDLYRKYENPSYGVNYYKLNNTWRKAELRFDGKLYNIRIKAQGASPTSHRKDNFISYSVKVLNKNNINNLTRFNLTIRERIQPNRLQNIYLAKKFNIIYQDDKLVRLKINGWNEKLYFMEDKLTSDLMEARYNSSLKLFRSRKPNEIVSDKALILYSYTDLDKISDNDTLRLNFEEIFDNENIKAESRKPIYDRYLNLNRFLLNPSIGSATEFFNMEYISSFEAVRMLRGFLGHGLAFGNTYLASNWSDGKFYPIIHRDFVPSFLFNSNVIESQLYRYDDYTIPLLVALNMSDEIRQQKYKKIYGFLSTNIETVSDSMKIIEEKYERLHYRGWFKQILRKLNFTSYSNIFYHNSKIIQKYLEQSNPRVEFADLGRYWVLKIQPNSMSAIKVNKIDFTYDSIGFSGETNHTVPLFFIKGDEYQNIQSKIVHFTGNNRKLSFDTNISELFDGLTEKMERIQREYYLVLDMETIPLKSPSVLEKIVFSNLVTSDEWTLRDVNVLKEVPGDLLNYLNIKHSLDVIPYEDNILSYTYFHPSEKQTLVIKNGTYFIDRDLIIPHGFNLIIDAGAHLILGPEVMLVGSRNLIINGTKSNPVIIESRSEDFPFGSIGFFGNGETRVSIENLLLSGGSEGWNKGIYFSGGLSLHNHSFVKIIHSSFHNNQADDGVNIKFANELLIENCKFYNNYADQVDLDYCIGQVVGSEFNNTLEVDANGDGLDISRSNLLIQASTFYGFRDKGISIGEDSRVFMIENEISENRHGIAIKDQSVLNIKDNNFKDNLLDIKNFQKKSIFGGATLKMLPSETRELSIYTDFRSRIIDSIEEGEWNLEYVMGSKNRKKHFIVNHNNSMYLQN